VKDIIAEIAKVIDSGGLLLGDDVTARPTDWHGLGNCEAKAVIRPKNTQQLSDVMKLCHAAGQTVVAEGGLTGLVHGVDPAQDDIVISFERMTDVEHRRVRLCKRRRTRLQKKIYYLQLIWAREAARRLAETLPPMRAEIRYYDMA